MPRPRPLTTEEIAEIQSARGRMSPNEIKEKYGIGSSHLYRIWREGAREQEIEHEAKKQAESKQSETDAQDALLHRMKQRIEELENVQQQPQDVLETRSLPEMRRGGEWLPEYNNRLLLDMNKKVDDIADKLQTIHNYVKFANEVLDLTQDEVESMASYVEDIDEKVDDVKSEALPKLSEVVEAVESMERIIRWSVILSPAVIFLYMTWKSVKRKDNFSPKPQVKHADKKIILPKEDYDDMYRM